ncbi:hypothetical protein SPRG_13437 [Saprolegnia parasitica CBS 223.65]|uniref:Uncharacterized protein n=1 Tax=Saprolegnia parasitica (strain CBS 223.65) TaxID=695850 RepID=A0A067C2D8_SAPPC|nr:hypothetical protein SPRG_13437 [Saprolegnia parasitica CBS 223.65]KDO20686.1 hypothetical protein SPRG_13437 [Saprolegnia parasitica CBS 223.65]|eukprot:XP_012208650.1 hypothetical protein SPRG_13437 [Saprolegnia parasitica CBS 223.65]
MAPVSPAKDASKPKKKATTISKSIARGLDTTSEPRTWVQTLHEAIEDISSFLGPGMQRELHVLMRGSDKEVFPQG